MVTSGSWSSFPVPVIGLSSGVIAVSAGAGHTCAVTTDGGVLCWGADDDGELGDGNTEWNSPLPVAVTGLSSGVTGLSAAVDHTCALTIDGGVLCWGSDYDGELGDGHTGGNCAVPVDVIGLPAGVNALSTGDGPTCAVTSAGAWCWGIENTGNAASHATTPSLVPQNDAGLPSNIRAISAGAFDSCALTSDAGVWCWGDNQYGELGNGAPEGGGMTVPVPVSGLPAGIVAVAVGGAHACALTSDAGVWCWGDNQFGELGNNTTVANSSSPVGVVGF